MRKLLGVVAVTALATVPLAIATAATVHAQGKKYVFALVPKNMNNPFFDQARDGCKKAEAESNGALECMYIGPGEHGGGDEQVQIVDDLIAKKVDGIAVSASNAAAVARRFRGPPRKIPVLTWDCDLLPTRTRACASPMSARIITTSASTSPSSSCRSSRRAERSASNRAAPPPPITMSACKAFATRLPARRARRLPESADRPKRLDGDRRLPALHR